MKYWIEEDHGVAASKFQLAEKFRWVSELSAYKFFSFV